MSNTTRHQESSRFDIFNAKAKEDISAYREKLKGAGTFSYVGQVIELGKLSNHMNQSLLVYLFGDQIGRHLAEKFAYKHQCNLLSFLSDLTSEYRFFILHELKNNELLFAYC